MADWNYEGILAILPLFLTSGLGAPVYAVGLVEGVADGASAGVRLWSGWYSDRIPWRRWLGTGGYATTVAGLAGLVVINAWPLVVVARGLAWMGRGLRQPVRSSMLAGSVARRDLGKAFGFHEALDTLGALAGPGVAFLLLSTGHGYRSVFLAALVPGALCVVLFGALTRDPRRGVPVRPAVSEALPGDFRRLVTAVAVFGAGNFAPAFFTLRAAEMLTPALGRTGALSGAVLFYLFHNGVGAAASFPGGWLADRLGKQKVLAGAYAAFSAACLAGIAGSGPLGVALMAVPVGISAPLVVATEQSLTGSLVPERASGTAFGVLGAVNGAGDLVSSVVTGLLWSSAGAWAGLGYGALLGLAGAVLLLLLVRRPQLVAAGQVLGE